MEGKDLVFWSSFLDTLPIQSPIFKDPIDKPEAKSLNLMGHPTQTQTPAQANF